MKDYYEILQIETNAALIEIKKAYFSLVRKYPADRFPEQFMAIREAYETLSNEKTREEYDKIIAMSPLERKSFEKSRKLMEEGEIKKAIQLLEDIVRVEPKSLLIRGLLAEVYRLNGNSGKAITLLEQLVEEDPKNAGFKGHLAHAYMERGWHKKAISAYDDALNADADNVSLWLGLSKAYSWAGRLGKAKDVLVNALEVGRDKDWDDISIYLGLIHVSLAVDINSEDVKKYVKDLGKKALEKEEIREHVGWILGELSRVLVSSGLIKQANILLEEVSILLPDNEDIKTLKREVESFKVIEEEFERLNEDDAIKKDVVNVIAIEVIPGQALGIDKKQREQITFMSEYHVLSEINLYKKSINRIKDRYPNLYKKKANFFEQAMDSGKRKKLLKTYEVNHRKFQEIFAEMGMNFFDENEFEDREFYEDEFYEDGFIFGNSFDFEGEIQEPFVKQEPSIGRNDPCSCGSGKKYKKCCGR